MDMMENDSGYLQDIAEELKTLLKENDLGLVTKLMLDLFTGEAIEGKLFEQALAFRSIYNRLEAKECAGGNSSYSERRRLKEDISQFISHLPLVKWNRLQEEKRGVRKAADPAQLPMSWKIPRLWQTRPCATPQ